MKNKLIIVLTVVSIIFAVMFIKSYSSYNSLSNKYSISMANNKAYQSQLDTVNNKSRVFQFKANQLAYLNDSIVGKLKEVQSQLKIKDKNLQELYYISSRAAKTDTIKLKGDTIFKDKSVKVDTLLGDQWYNIRIKLQYPSTIITSPTFKSEKYVVTSYQKEYINTPSKLWIVRLFQKKQKVVIVDVVEKNPYITNGQNRFIQIVK